MKSKIVIIGAGGVGREIAAVLKHDSFSYYDLLGFIDDHIDAGTKINNIEVLGNIDWLISNCQNYGIVLAIGNPIVRKKIINKLKKHSFLYPSIIHSNVSIHDIENVIIGEGCYIADGVIITTNVTIENFCFVNTFCALQHDSYVCENSVLMPGVKITGGAKIGSNTFISANCVIASPCEIAENSVITESIL